MAVTDGTQKGHGKMGLRSGMATMNDLFDNSANVKEVLVELKPIKQVKDWALSGGSIYVSALDITYDNKRLDVVGVATRTNPELTRKERSTSLTAGTYFYDPTESYAQTTIRWDGAGTWDDGVLKWDQFPSLYIRLDDSSNPNDDTVAAKLGFFFASRAQSHPTLGPDLLKNGGLENWTSGVGSPSSGWTKLVGAGGTITRSSTRVISDTYSARFSGASGQEEILYQSVSIVPLKYYRLSGYYVSNAIAGGLELCLQSAVATSAGYSVGTDGRTRVSGPNYVSFTDSPSTDTWRFFTCDFYAMTTTVIAKFKNNPSTTTRVSYLDNVKLQRIWLYEYYQPKVAKGAIPVTDSSSQDIYFGGKSVGVGTIHLLNQDRYFEHMGGYFEWMNQGCIVKVGGRYAAEPQADETVSDGQEILLNDMKDGFTGKIQRLSVDDTLIRLDLQDERSTFHRMLPERVYDEVDLPNLDSKDFQGKARPIFFGVKSHINPARTDYDGTNTKYGNYEICDTTDAPNGIKSIDAVYAYDSKTAADESTTSLRKKLTETTHYTTDLTNAVFDVIVDVGPYLVKSGVTDKIDFSEGGAELTGSIAVGQYTAAGLAAAIQTAMRAVGAGNENVTYSESTNKFTISKGAGTLALKVTSGTNKNRSIYKTIGFTTERSGSLSYLGDEVTFTAVDTDHYIRCDAQGYKDTAAGAYTGTANALIEVGAHVCKTLLIEFMGKQSGIIDSTSFAYSAERAPESLALFLNSTISTREIFERLEFSNIANIVITGAGTVKYIVYTGTTSTEKTALTHVQDWHISDFSIEQDATEIFKTVKIYYNQDPSLNTYYASSATDLSVPVRLGRPDIKEIYTYIRILDNANNAAGRFLELARRAARKVTMTVKGSLLMNHEVGDKIRITRRRGLSIGGVIVDTVFRIVNVKKNYLTGDVQVDLVDDRVTVASAACITSCQSFCESTCQEVCEQACQTLCELSCQSSCEVGCQELCQTACQTTCETTCQTACELSCKTACQLACQGACEGGGCQTACEASCQTTCQLACQSACQLACQGACQLACQQTCQLACQNCTQITCQSCQNTCKLACQTTCELQCQTTCQLSCQTICQTGCQHPSAEG